MPFLLTISEFFPSGKELIGTLIATIIVTLIPYLINKFWKNWFVIQYSKINKAFSNNIYIQASKLDFSLASRINNSYLILVMFFVVATLMFVYYLDLQDLLLKTNSQLNIILPPPKHKINISEIYSSLTKVRNDINSALEFLKYSFIYLSILIIFSEIRRTRNNFINSISVEFLQNIKQIKLLITNDEYDLLMFMWSTMKSKEDYHKIRELLVEFGERVSENAEEIKNKFNKK